MRIGVVIGLLLGCSLTFAQTVPSSESGAAGAVLPQDSVLDALYGEATSFFKAGAYTQAAEVFTRVLSLKPGFARAYNDRGSCYRRMGLYEKALADYSQAIRYEPCAIFYNNRAGVRMKMDDLEAAIADYTIAYALDSTYYPTLNNRGIAFLNTGEYRQAVTDFSACIRWNPDSYLAYNNRGIAYYKLKAFDLSIADFDKAISLRENYGNAYLHRGNLKEMLDDEAGACADWSRAAALGVGQAQVCLEHCKE
ncbi:MAG: tetratricopeptide repeat protein [Bacteroidales bacterium]|nr:tetratricopeptide repeat protein [Bacteroidales bacterium]